MHRSKCAALRACDGSPSPLLPTPFGHFHRLAMIRVDVFHSHLRAVRIPYKFISRLLCCSIDRISSSADPSPSSDVREGC